MTKDELKTLTLNQRVKILKLDLEKGFYTKKVNWKAIVEENIWFLSGKKSINEFNLKFWEPWVDPKTGEVPSAYGHRWRTFPAPAGS